MKLSTSIWHFVQRGNRIRPHMDIEQAVDQKLGYKEVSKKTLDKLESIYNATVEHLERSGAKRVAYLVDFKSKLDEVQRGVDRREPSKATSDLQTLIRSFRNRLAAVGLEAARADKRTEPDSTLPKPRARFNGPVDTSERSDRVLYLNRDVPVSPPPVVPAAIESHAELRIGHVASHESNLIDPRAMSLVEAFACKTHNVAVSNETLRKLDKVFEHCSGITLHACEVDPHGKSVLPVLKSYDFASPYRKGFIPLFEMTGQLADIETMIDGMKECRAKTVLTEKHFVYEAHILAAWEFWRAAESKAQTHRFSVEPGTFKDPGTALLMDQNLLRRALTWQGTSSQWRDLVVSALR